MQEIFFVTSNNGKIKALERRLDPAKYKVSAINIDLPEIQAHNASEIAEYKANYAYKKLQKPVVVQDSSFHIDALKGFPGPYIKFVNETIGPYGLLQLMDGVKDRSCHFELALVYVDEKGNSHTFVNKGGNGRLASAVYEGDSENSWSSLWKIYIPPHHDKPLAALSNDELKAKESNNDQNSEFEQFARWLKENDA